MLVRKFHVALLLLICSLLAIGAFAQNATTGAIEGTVKTGGTPLPGVTIEVRSPNLQGVRTQVTDAGGNFRFTLLPQGIYTVTANLQGFNRINQPNVAVEINRTKTLDINMDFIAEENVLTGGMPAEYGRLTGGAIVAVTKSGSNEFHGDAFGYDSTGGLRAKPTFGSSVPSDYTTITNVSQQYDFGANVGGYIMKDRLWFFGAYDRVKQTDQSIRVNTPLIVSGFSLAVGGFQPTDI